MGKLKGKSGSQDRELGQEIKSIRLDKKLTLRHMAELTGISPQQFQKYEIGEDRIPAIRFLTVCDILQTSPSYFADKLKEIRLS